MFLSLKLFYLYIFLFSCSLPFYMEGRQNVNICIAANEPKQSSRKDALDKHNKLWMQRFGGKSSLFASKWVKHYINT